MMDFLFEIFPYALAFTAPILITALGGLFSERSGVVNIGLEGLMVVGSFAAAFTMYKLTNGNEVGHAVTSGMLWTAILASVLAGGVFSILHAYASITLKANQIISGTAINMLAAASTLFLAEFFSGSERLAVATGVARKNVTFFGGNLDLSKIPFIGDLFFTRTYFTTYLVLAIVAIMWYVLMKIPFGLRLRACGEYPQAAESMGINVTFMRYVGVILSGCFAGLGGGILVLTYNTEFTGTVSGLGFLALATLIFGQWKPWKVLGASFFFGFMRTMATMARVNDELKTLGIPQEVYRALPYALTLIALLIFSKNTVGPKALGETFDSGKR